MTNDVIEILRHHENPRHVLARGIPRFKPFDLHAALTYSARTFGEDSLFIEPCIIAAYCNAHCKNLVWLLTSEGEPNPYHYAHHYWGFPRPVRQSAGVRFYQRSGHYWVLVNPDPTSPTLCEVEFLFKRTDYYYDHNAQRFEALESLIVDVILEEWRAITPLVSFEQKSLDFKVAISLLDLGAVIARFEALFTGDELYTFDAERYACTPGDLLRTRADKQGITKQELEQWTTPATPPPPSPLDPEGAMPTFVLPPEQAVLPFEARTNRGDFDDSDIPF